MNIQAHTATGFSPYELVFGLRPHSVLFPSAKSKELLMEEDLERDGIIDKFKVADASPRKNLWQSKDAQEEEMMWNKNHFWRKMWG